jgi:dihydrofolate reductase
MGKLVYSMIVSLDGYVNDAQGQFGWGAPDEELHVFIGEQSRSLGTYLYGRRIYETMLFWETAHTLPDAPPFVVEYAQVWQAAEKVVHSTTLQDVASARSRLVRSFDPEAVGELKAASPLDVSVHGPHLAAHALRAGLVDEVQLYVAPVLVGGGTRFFPDDVQLDLELLDQRRFGGGVLYLRYGVQRG